MIKELIEQSKIVHKKSQELCEKTKLLLLHSKSLYIQARVLRNYKTTKFILKTCRCGCSFTPADWNMLKFIGFQILGKKEGELRDCHCHSTLMVPFESDKEK